MFDSYSASQWQLHWESDATEAPRNRPLEQLYDEEEPDPVVGDDADVIKDTPSFATSRARCSRAFRRVPEYAAEQLAPAKFKRYPWFGGKLIATVIRSKVPAVCNSQMSTADTLPDVTGPDSFLKCDVPCLDDSIPKVEEAERTFSNLAQGYPVFQAAA